MGMDVLGHTPTCFRRSVWVWHPLAEYVCEVAPDITAACEYWHSNDGDGLDMEASLRLADALEAEISSGRTERYAILRRSRLEQLPNEPCSICEGTGTRKPPPEVGAGDLLNSGVKCNGCAGNGYREPTARCG
jgi:hypothetical protein